MKKFFIAFLSTMMVISSVQARGFGSGFFTGAATATVLNAATQPRTHKVVHVHEDDDYYESRKYKRRKHNEHEELKDENRDLRKENEKLRKETKEIREEITELRDIVKELKRK